VATFIIAFLAPPLGNLALRFQAPEYFSLMLLGLIAFIVLAQGSLLKALGMMVLGLIGTDVTSASQRFTFGLPALSDGINFVVVAMGVFGVAEIVGNLEDQRPRVVFAAEISRLLPSREGWRRLVAPVLRGTAMGSLLRILPGGGALLASFAAYAVEKRVSAHGFEFGKGAI
jgi:putative tricarboxylic transport membrane protein